MYYLEIFRTTTGNEPYIDWLESLDTVVRARIKARLTRVRETGNLGIYDPVGDGVYELKLDFGPGYRVYFGLEKEIMILLFGGNKKAQQKDINKSKEFWQGYLSSGGRKK